MADPREGTTGAVKDGTAIPGVTVVLSRVGMQRLMWYHIAYCKLYIYDICIPDCDVMCEVHCLRSLDSAGFPWNCGVSAMINGLMGGMAFLYGGGDFRRTVGVAIAAGFDCDNQAATLGGLIGVMHGGKAIPYDLTHKSQGSNRGAPI